MIIDVTRKPLIVFSDEITDSVVVRSIGNREVSGLVTFLYERRNMKARTISLEPGASLTRGDSTCFETRILLPGSKGPKENPYDFTRDYFNYNYNDEAAMAKQAKILPEPFEVASYFKDPVTGFSGTWRVGIRAEKHKNGKTWLVAISDSLTGTLLCTIATRGLDPNPQILETLPLKRATRNVVVGTAWDRILHGDDD